jgi:HEAT repeat protein
VKAFYSVGIWAGLLLSMTPALGQTQPPVDTQQRCWTLLDDAAKGKNPDVRKDAAEALSLVPVSDKILQSLGTMLDDHDVTVRVAVIVSLGDFKDKRTIPLLKKALHDPVPEVVFAAAKVLYQLHDPDGERMLLAIVGGEAKGSSGYLSTEKRNALRMLHTPTKLFMFAAIQAAGMVVPVPGLGMGISSAQGILSNPDSSARAAALLLIAQSHDPALEDRVGSGLSDKDWSLRAAAAHVVATHPFPAFREKLAPLLDDKKGPVRLRAAAAYIRLQPPTKAPPTKTLPPKGHAAVH